MFKELIDALRQRPLIGQMWSEMDEMMRDAVDMYRPIASVLAGREELTKVTRDRVYETDRRINHLQRKIRKQLVEHLVASPGSHVPISLVLMSITKDAERVGDICKNLLEVAEAAKTPPGVGKYGERVRGLLAEGEALFEPTATGLINSDKKTASAALESARALAHKCDAMINDLMGDDLPTRDAVLLTLTARYLKRVSLHLSNIASSVVMPLHRMDYFDEEGSPPQ
jgi:phosphate transport system protein